jgi:hypothetical protein
MQQTRVSTTSNSYVSEVSVFRFRTVWNKVFWDSQSVVKLTVRKTVGAGEEHSTRAFNQTDNEGVVSTGGKTSTGAYDTGWVDYAPATTQDIISIDFQHKTEPGSNSSTSEEPVLLFGTRI